MKKSGPVYTYFDGGDSTIFFDPARLCVRGVLVAREPHKNAAGWKNGQSLRAAPQRSPPGVARNSFGATKLHPSRLDWPHLGQQRQHRNKCKQALAIIPMLFALMLTAIPAQATEQGTMFVHLKTSLKHDDAQICVAYNVIWEALKEGMAVNVLVDADGINTFKTGLLSDTDSIQGYKIPENLRASIARQLNVPPGDVPKTYGDYLILLHKEGARFYVNKGFLIVAGIAPEPDKDMGKLADYVKKIFKPVTFKEMLELRRNADFDYTY